MKISKSSKSWYTFYRAKLWAGSARESVDATIEAFLGKLSMKGARLQGVRDVSNHFLGATLLRQVLGLRYSLGEEEQDCTKPRGVGDKHVLVLRWFRL